MANARNPTISREQSVRFVAPAPSTGGEHLAEAAAQVAGSLAEVRANQLTTNLEDELLTAQEQALLEIEQNLNAPEAEGGTSLSAGEAMSLQEFTEKMSDLQSAANQGTSSMTQLKIRQERILRDYMSRYPGLRPRFQQAASGVLGYSPIGAQVRAAEAAEGAASGGAMNPILSMMLRSAESVGVDPSLYVRNPQEFWAQAQHKWAQRQRITTYDDATKAITSVQGLAFATSQPEWAQFTADMAEIVWSEQLNPVIQSFYEDLKITPGMSYQQRQAIIEGAMNDGRYRQLQLGLMREREQGIRGMYERYQQSGIGTTTEAGVTVPVMPYAAFREKITPILEQYDWAIANMNDPKAMEMMEMFNKARSNRIISGMPDDLMTLAEMGKLFGADNTFSQILTQGQLGDTASVIVSDYITRQFGGVGMGGRGGPDSGAVAPSSGNGSIVRPQRGDPTSRLFTIDEVVRMTGVAVEDADQALGMINHRLGQEWLHAYNTTNDPVYAIGVWTLAKEYGNMVTAAASTRGSLPSKETDNIMLGIVSDPLFAQAAIAGTTGSQHRERDMQGLLQAIHVRASEEVDEALGQVVYALEQDSIITEPPNTTRFGRPGAPTVEKLAGQVANYVDFDIDHKSYTLEFKLRDDIPEYNRKALENLVTKLNRDIDPRQEETLVRLAMATAHTFGYNSPQAYRHAIKNTFGLGE